MLWKRFIVRREKIPPPKISAKVLSQSKRRGGITWNRQELSLFDDTRPKMHHQPSHKTGKNNGLSLSYGWAGLQERKFLMNDRHLVVRNASSEYLNISLNSINLINFNEYFVYYLNQNNMKMWQLTTLFSTGIHWINGSGFK